MSPSLIFLIVILGVFFFAALSTVLNLIINIIRFLASSIMVGMLVLLALQFLNVSAGETHPSSEPDRQEQPQDSLEQDTVPSEAPKAEIPDPDRI